MSQRSTTFHLNIELVCIMMVRLHKHALLALTLCKNVDVQAEDLASISLQQNPFAKKLLPKAKTRSTIVQLPSKFVLFAAK